MRLPWLLLTLALLAGAAHADTRAHEDEELARYQNYAGAPIDEFPIFRIRKWLVVGPERLVIWSTISDAYLIRVEKPCVRLEWTHAVVVTQRTRQKVSKKSDFVEFGNQRCRIAEILPVDYRKMLKDGAAGEAGLDVSPKTPEAQDSGGT
ncbi:MAG TPA: DUF6491 family protein [Rudaea sp.]|nr:DUF6491 family protein [Rudaea sp.]